MKTSQNIFESIIVCLIILCCNNSCSTVQEGDTQTVCPHCSSIVNEVYCSNCKGHLTFQLGHLTPEDEIVIKKNKEIRGLKNRLDDWQHKYDSIETKYRNVVLDPSVSTAEARAIYDEINTWVNTNLRNLFDDYNDLNIEDVKDFATLRRLLATISDKISGYNILLQGMSRFNDERDTRTISDTIKFVNIIGHGSMSIQEVNDFIQKLEKEDRRKGGIISRLQNDKIALQNENERLREENVTIGSENSNLKSSNAELITKNKKLEDQNNAYKELLLNYEKPSISNIRLGTKDGEKLAKNTNKLIITFDIDWREFKENSIKLSFKIYYPMGKNDRASGNCLYCPTDSPHKDKNGVDQYYSCSATISHNNGKGPYTATWNRCNSCETNLFPGKYDVTVYHDGMPIGYQNDIQINKK